MIGPLPKRPSGSSPEALFMQWLWDSMQSNRPAGPVTLTTRGTFTRPPAQMPATSGARAYRLKSVQADYLTCRTWDGTNEGDSDVYVAKNPKLWNSITTETKLGVVHTYTYSDGPDAHNKYRTDTWLTGNTETQQATPPWCVNDVIFAMPAKTNKTAADGSAITLIDLHTRHWMRI